MLNRRRMGLLQHLAIALLFSAQLGLTFPAIGTTSDECEWCSAGAYQKFCKTCAPCPAGQFTTGRNQETSCHRCFGDCRANLNLMVVQNCTSTSNVKCVCKTGFTCVVKDSNDAEICKACDENQETTTLATSLGLNKQTPLSASLGRDSSSAKPCQFPKCGPQTVSTPSNNTAGSPLAAILTPAVLMACMGLVILFCVRRPGDETCFKRAIEKLYNEGGHEASHKSKESTHHFPRDSFSARQQPSSLPAANLGPVHVHNPGTVIFSLLSQFTGQVGPTVEGKGPAEKVSSEEDDERDCPVFHPAPSPSIGLSEEERSAEIDSIFFPSQEQGKDCHVSKEEEL